MGNLVVGGVEVIAIMFTLCNWSNHRPCRNIFFVLFEFYLTQNGKREYFTNFYRFHCFILALFMSIHMQRNCWNVLHIKVHTHTHKPNRTLDSFLVWHRSRTVCISIGNNVAIRLAMNMSNAAAMVIHCVTDTHTTQHNTQQTEI